jgi:protein TonB
MVDNRPFHYAIAASLALHAVVLFAFPDLIDTARRAVRFPPPLIARLMAPEPPAPVPAPPAPPVETPQPAPVSKAPAPPKAAPAPPKAVPAPAKPIPAPVPEREPVAEVPASATSDAGPSAPAAVPPAVASIPALPAQPAPAAPAGPVFDMRSRTEYRIDLIGEAGRIKQNKPYPPQAYENHWEGEVLLSVVVAANGRPSITVRRSSQHEVLDRHAVEIYRDAFRNMSIPPALRGKEFAFEVEVVYKR